MVGEAGESRGGSVNEQVRWADRVLVAGALPGVAGCVQFLGRWRTCRVLSHSRLARCRMLRNSRAHCPGRRRPQAGQGVGGAS